MPMHGEVFPKDIIVYSHPRRGTFCQGHLRTRGGTIDHDHRLGNAGLGDVLQGHIQHNIWGKGDVGLLGIGLDRRKSHKRPAQPEHS